MKNKKVMIAHYQMMKMTWLNKKPKLKEELIQIQLINKRQEFSEIYLITFLK